MLLLKLTLSKTFDTISWPFILKTLSCFGFNDTFCNWISTIFHSSTMSIGFNGKQSGYFTSSNGVKQGDPLSPLLLCLVEEVLSRGLTKLVETDQINLVRASRNSFVDSHTIFADDIMIFCRGDQKSLTAISKLLDDYACCSGQYCNKLKSLIYVGGV